MELINTFFSRSGYSPNMGGRKVYDKGNQYLYSNPVYEDSIYTYRSNVFFNDHVSFCKGGYAELTPFADYQSYLWSTGSTASSIVVIDSGQYVLHVIDQFNNSFTDTLYVEINPLPAVSLGHDTTLQFGEYIALSLDMAMPIGNGISTIGRGPSIISQMTVRLRSIPFRFL